MTATVSTFALVQPELALVEEALAATARTEDPIVAPILSLVLPGSGKRLRPALALLAARLGRYPGETAIHMAVGVELLHAASLVHDDVVDETDRRRGEATLFTRVGNAVAVLVGDYLFSQSAARCVATGDLRVIGLFAETLGSMARGQIEEASRESDAHLSLTREAYYQTIWAKTASLFVLACQGGAILSRIPEPQVQALRTYGEKLGLAFQVVDDILDFVGDERALGKPVGSDLRQGVITLPVIYLRDELKDGAFRRTFEQRAVEELVQLVRESEAVERCRAEAAALARESREVLRALDPSPCRDALEALTHYVVHRLR
ncbi:MAG: polyprenyl synthetase family protein [Chloroflexi bacterium]|nr:polyprenyl synthetase family protein [Chloroflexota bacterium]